VASLKEEICKKMEEDPNFTSKLSALLEQVQETESGKIIIKADTRSVAAQNIIGSTISTGDRNSSKED